MKYQSEPTHTKPVLGKPSQPEAVRIGVSQPALLVEELPTPEEVFRVRRVGVGELLMLVVGPGLIALGFGIGSGEWLLGPLNISQRGFVGIGWVIIISAVLQVFFNVEAARFTIATGETPIMAYGRTPPGKFIMIPLAVASFYMAFILGGWAVSAGESLFAVVTGRPRSPEELEIVKLVGIGLMLVSGLLLTIGRRIERTLEIIQGALVTFILVSLVTVCVTIIPLQFIGDSLLAAITPSLPTGSDPDLLGALAGFTAMASGLNFAVMSYYRDKGYGMGYKSGFLNALFAPPIKAELAQGAAQGAGTAPLQGRIFPETPRSQALWKRWFRYLLFDQWVIFFPGVLAGMFLPSILVGYLVSLPGAAQPDSSNILVYAATQLGARYGSYLYGWALVMGFLILFSTQIAVLDLLSRTMTDAFIALARRRRDPQSAAIRQGTPWQDRIEAIAADPRRFYYPWLVITIIAISSIIMVTGTEAPPNLLKLSGNLANFAALIFPLASIYLNLKLPRPARITWWSVLVLLANTIFFGFFFINFLSMQLFNTPLVIF